MRVKICGITNLDDAQAAVALGADALGFVFAGESPRSIAPKEAEKIVASLPPFVVTVAVVTGGDETHLRHLLDDCGVQMLQLHGNFPDATLARFADRAILAVRMKEGIELRPPAHPVRALLLDGFHEHLLGGTGMTFDWSLAAKAKSWGPIILAGGLTPENVRQACETAEPYAVDVSSGVEAFKGKKDHDKLARFIRAAKGESFSRSPA
jgi:phosphoribosylanthranilate isomerase